MRWPGPRFEAGVLHLNTPARVAVVAALIGVCSSAWATGAKAGDDAVPSCLGVPATIVGTDDDDDLVGTPDADVIVAGQGVDGVYGAGGDDLICGGPTPYRVDSEGIVARSNLSGGRGDDIVVGGKGYDTISGDAGSDVLRGGAGPDRLLGDESFTDQRGADQLFGGRGADQLTGELGDDQVHGGPGSDDVVDSFGQNIVLGGKGNDVLRSGRNNDWLRGGRGHDVVSFDQIYTFEIDLCEPITVDLRGTHVVTQGWGRDTLTGIEGAWTSRGDDVMIGDRRSNSFYVGSVSCGDENQDRVFGGIGRDTLTFETYRTEGIGDGVITGLLVDLGKGNARLESENGTINVTFSSIENVLGSLGPDTILGDEHVNKLTGGPGSQETDLIRGRGGDDRVFGDRGQDWLYGGIGNDQLWGLDGNDHLDGGSGNNINDGGAGVDVCVRPQHGQHAVQCES